jgi:hypothetical protein
MRLSSSCGRYSEKVSQLPDFPDFFVVGAPRCGTTAICRYLARNPQICFSRPKEPHYFSRLDHDPSTDELKRNYLERNFSHYEPTHRTVGEGSVSYLYLPGVIERVNQLNPDARFVVLVRNPLSMLPSWHLRMQFLLQEDEPDFSKAWELEPSREHRGENLPKRCMDPRLLYYSQAAKFGVQIERLFNVAGRDRSHVIVFDDFKSDPLSTYRSLLEFLNVDYDGQTEFERRYESQMYRYGWLQRLLFVPATSSGKTVETLQRRARKYNPDGSKKPSFIKRVTAFNKVPMAPAPLTPEMADTIRETLLPDVRHLSELLGRDLTFWFDEES